MLDFGICIECSTIRTHKFCTYWEVGVWWRILTLQHAAGWSPGSACTLRMCGQLPPKLFSLWCHLQSPAAAWSATPPSKQAQYSTTSAHICWAQDFSHHVLCILASINTKSSVSWHMLSTTLHFWHHVAWIYLFVLASINNIKLTCQFVCWAQDSFESWQHLAWVSLSILAFINNINSHSHPYTEHKDFWHHIRVSYLLEIANAFIHGQHCAQRARQLLLVYDRIPTAGTWVIQFVHQVNTRANQPILANFVAREREMINVMPVQRNLHQVAPLC